MPGIKWVQQILEIEQRESAKQQLLRNNAKSIFGMLKNEVAQCIEDWNAARAGDTNRLLIVDVGAEGDALTITIRDRGRSNDQMKLIYKVMEARLDFECPGQPPHLAIAKGTATIELDELPTTVPREQRGGYTPVFTIQGQRGQISGAADLIEHRS